MVVERLQNQEWDFFFMTVWFLPSTRQTDCQKGRRVNSREDYDDLGRNIERMKIKNST